MRRQSSRSAPTAALDEVTLRRYRRLRRLPRSRWQGAIVVFPFVGEVPATGAPRQIRGVIWVAENPPGLASRLLDQTPGLPDADVCALTFLDLAFDSDREAPKGRPALIEVTDETLGRSVVERIGDSDVTVRVVERLDHVEAVLSVMGKELPSAGIPPALDAPGVTVDRLAAYADAARAFHRAALWEHLTGDDLLTIESPVPDASLSHVVVTGNRGVHHGLTFFESPEHHDQKPGPGLDTPGPAAPRGRRGRADGLSPDETDHDPGPESEDDYGADRNGDYLDDLALEDSGDAFDRDLAAGDNGKNGDRDLDDLDDTEPGFEGAEPDGATAELLGGEDANDDGLEREGEDLDDAELEVEGDDPDADWEDGLDEDEDAFDEDMEGRPDGIWSLTFEARPVLPPKDVAAWLEHDLPYNGTRSHPLAARFWSAGCVDRPDAAQLAFLEGLLRALAATTEDDLDSGRWQKTVATFDGPADYRFALPTVLEIDQSTPRRFKGRRLPDRRVLERTQAEMRRFLAANESGSIEEANQAIRARFTGPMDAIPSTAGTPLECAQDICYLAAEASGRGRVVLARRALALSSDCADAWVLLAEHEARAERALDLFREGVAAGERALGGEWADEPDRPYWADHRTRPYMRARFGAASALEVLDRADEAAAEYLDLLRLNPSDNQGARYPLLDILLAAGRDEEARDLLARYEEDAAASWLWGRALVEYRLRPAGPAAERALFDAIEANRYVLAFFEDPDTLDQPVPERLDLGGPSDALDAAERQYDAWAATPGALDWAFTLAATVEEERRQKSRRARSKVRRRGQISRQSRRRNRRGRG